MQFFSINFFLVASSYVASYDYHAWLTYPFFFDLIPTLPMGVSVKVTKHPQSKDNGRDFFILIYYLCKMFEHGFNSPFYETLLGFFKPPDGRPRGCLKTSRTLGNLTLSTVSCVSVYGA